MMSKLVVPCIAEFPRLDDPREHASEGLPAVRLSVAHEWLVHEFGEELARVEGLPLDAIISLYPEGEDVVFFSLARGTTMLGDLQEVLDSVARAVMVIDLTLLSKLSEVRQLAIQNIEMESTIVPVYHWVTTLEAQALHSDIVWAINQVLRKNGNFLIDRPWFELYKLGMFVCAPLLVKAESRASYLSGEPDWEPVFAALGLDDLWVKASARVEGWRSGDDDV